MPRTREQALSELAGTLFITLLLCAMESQCLDAMLKNERLTILSDDFQIGKEENP